MARRVALFVAVLGGMIALASVAAQKKEPGKLLILDWASKAEFPTPPVTLLVEMGLKDEKPTPWSGKAIVEGARLVHREGYRFRSEDKLVDPDAWEASSHRGIRVPPRNPAVSKQEPLATVGIVLHLAELTGAAAVTITPKDTTLPAATFNLKEVLDGKRLTLWEGRAVVRRITTAVPVANGKTEDDFPAAAYGPDGTLWIAYISYTVKDERRRIESQPLKEQPKDFKEFVTPEYGDQLFVKSYRQGKWSEPIAVTPPNEDLVRCAIAVSGANQVWVFYSAHRGPNHVICGRCLTPGNRSTEVGVEQRLSNLPGPNLTPAACTDPRGTVLVAWQMWRPDGQSSLQLLHIPAGATSVDPRTAIPTEVAATPNRHWHPVLAAGLDNRSALGADVYYREYDSNTVELQMLRGAMTPRPQMSLQPTMVLPPDRFQARPALTFDTQGNLWLAYEEGPERWGKDFGALGENDGHPLYDSRSVRVLCLKEVDGKFVPYRLAAALPTANVKLPTTPYDGGQGPNYERTTRYSNPQLGLDGKGRLWLTYRQKFGSRYSSHPGSYWQTFARRLDGDHWSEPIEVHHSDGLLDHRPVLLPHKDGGLLIVHNTDGRYTTPEQIDNQVYLSHIDLPGTPVEPKLTDQAPTLVDHAAAARGKAQRERASREAAAVKQIRGFRLNAQGKNYRLLRGEFHRHTEISWDGGPDGSLEDMFRYGLDAAAFDWLGNGDHDSGAGREYTWWLIQKFSDAYHIPGQFTPMFTYERSVAYPHGHRNCIFAQRGVRTLPRLAAKEEERVGGVHADDTKMLYRYLRELGGICASHTSATSMGTDWRDHDSAVEPMVEIYQGDRMSYEKQGAPRAGFDVKSGKLPVNIAGWYPAGFIDNALKKGHRLAFQASSDHWSTHISYCIVLAESNTRTAILDAMRQRRCYGATDDIILDVRSGTHLMGEELTTKIAPSLSISVYGTAPLAEIVVLKDSKEVETFKLQGREFTTTWTDPQPTVGMHYYYVRVRQQDEELAWGSPLWINYSR